MMFIDGHMVLINTRNYRKRKKTKMETLETTCLQMKTLTYKQGEE